MAYIKCNSNGVTKFKEAAFRYSNMCSFIDSNGNYIATDASFPYEGEYISMAAQSGSSYLCYALKPGKYFVMGQGYDGHYCGLKIVDVPSDATFPYSLGSNGSGGIIAL